MNLSLELSEFENYILKQLDHFFPDNYSVDKSIFSKSFNMAIQRLEYCFKHVSIKSYCFNQNAYLNHLHSDQYAVFLWFLSNTVWKETQDEILSSKLFYLNKILHGLNCMYDTKLPDIFLLLHVSGTILGKAEYSDFFIATHGCTVGAHNGKYPKLGKGVSMLTNSSIIGDCEIGDRVSVGAKTLVYQKNIDDNIIVYTDSTGQICFKQKDEPWGQKFFNAKI